MLTYTTYSEGGGVGKTTLAANLAIAHAENGHDVLVVDMEPQDGSLSFLLGVDDDREREDVDTIVHHLIDRPRGDFGNLVRTAEGVDIVPSHNMLEKAKDLLDKAGKLATETGESFEVNKRLRRVLADANVPEKYDVIIADPPATTGELVYNSIDATRSVLMPVELTQKGIASINGLESVVEGMEATDDISVGVLAAVPNEFKGTNDQKAVLEELEESKYATPVTFRERDALFGGCLSEHCSAFKFVEEHRDRKRDRELDTLDKIRELAATLEAEAGL